VERDRRILIATSANCLQPDGQYDNDWNQGLRLLNLSQIRLQPSGYVTQMLSHNHLLLSVRCEITAVTGTLDVSAKRSGNGKAFVLQTVNPTDRPVRAQIHLAGFAPRKPTAQVTELSGSLDSTNAAPGPVRSFRNHTIESTP
jgi:hypothetical protein